MGQAFDDQPRSWGPLFSGLPRREGPDHTALLDFLEQNRARALAAKTGLPASFHLGDALDAARRSGDVAAFAPVLATAPRPDATPAAPD